MKTKTLGLIAALLIVGPMAANATSIVGQWEGSWTNNNQSWAADFDLTFTSQNAHGLFGGYFDWNCTMGLTCSGREYVAGTQVGNNLVFFTTGIEPGAHNIGPAGYIGSLQGDYSMSGRDSGKGWWRAWRVASSVPEPTTLALLGLGLIAMGLSRRRQMR